MPKRSFIGMGSNESPKLNYCTPLFGYFKKILAGLYVEKGRGSDLTLIWLGAGFLESDYRVNSTGEIIRPH